MAERFGSEWQVSRSFAPPLSCRIEGVLSRLYLGFSCAALALPGNKAMGVLAQTKTPGRSRASRFAMPENQEMVLPKATAVSPMRFEKPHSLSYQDRTETKLPSMTLVWSSATIEECGSWLKSIDTFG